MKNNKRMAKKPKIPKVKRFFKRASALPVGIALQVVKKFVKNGNAGCIFIPNAMAHSLDWTIGESLLLLKMNPRTGTVTVRSLTAGEAKKIGPKGEVQAEP